MIIGILRKNKSGLILVLKKKYYENFEEIC